MSHAATLRDLRMAVLFGGESAEREVSLHSAATILGVLRDGGYTPLALDTGEANWWSALTDVDLAFNIQHGPGGEDGETQGMLASMGVAITGSDVLGSALSMDKLRSKQVWQAAGLPTADYVIADESVDAAELLDRWGAAFIKPAREGSSIGMARVSTAAEFSAAVTEARGFDSVVLAERLIDGPEYTVAIVGERTLPAICIEATNTFYDYQAKYHSDTTRYLLPCGLTTAEETAMAELSLRAFQALHCSGWGRVDLMREPDGQFQLLEVNTVPGMTSHSLVPMAAKAAGMSLLELVEEILVLAWDAHASKGAAA